MDNHFVYTRWSRRAIHTEAGGGNDLDPDEGNQTSCGVCTLPIFSTPYHTSYDHDGNPSVRHNCCSQQQLPQVVMQHPLHRGGPLHLHDDPHVNIRCNNCRKDCKGIFFYQCPDGLCRFALDVKCCTRVKVAHRSHKHELAFIPRKDNLLTCGACGMQHQGFFYGCDLCQFYLHQDCAVLPNIILHKNHEDMQHPLALVFSFPKKSLKFERCKACSICNKELSSKKSAGVYVCLRCDDTAIHVKCAAISQKSADFRTVSCRDTANGLPHFPMKNERTGLLPYLLEHHQSNSGTIEEEENKFFNDKMHHHELVLVLYDKHKHCDEPSSSQLSRLCDACAEPISTPFYTCPQCNDFHLHRCCANLPLSVQHSLHFRSASWEHVEHLMKLIIPTSPGFSSQQCSGCLNSTNGFLYQCQTCAYTRLCVRCALLPNAITYELHGKSHILFLSNGYTQDTGAPSLHCLTCAFVIESSLFYECSSCPNFTIHVRCALLPTNVSHKYDRHPLELTPSQGSAPKDDNDENFCEICEWRMDTDKWFYHCKECATSFHTKCIPNCGRDSKIITGKTIRVDSHDCPLTSIQMLTNYSYTCSHCKKNIRGKEDNIAFECTKCSFWLHDWCAFSIFLKSLK